MTRSSAAEPSFTSPVSRRNFLRVAGLAGVAGAALVAPTPFLGKAGATTLTSRLGTTVRRWSDPATWGGRVPGPKDIAVIAGAVRLDKSVRVAGIRVKSGGLLTFHPRRSLWLQSIGNVIVWGKLQMRPANPGYTHQLTFLGANEGRFVGGGMEVLRSDVGLWVMNAGQLDLAGSGKLPWTRAAGDLAAGATSIELVADPVGWRVGDVLAIAPTAEGASPKEFDEVSVTSVAGRVVSLSAPLGSDHPARDVGGATMTAEVLNLTRNVRIEGRPGRRAHIFMHSTRKQAIRRVAVRHVGPQRNGSIVTGRYGVHFHHCLGGSRGSLVDSVVVRDCGTRGFVPHASHGITFRKCIVYRAVGDGYWWDPPDEMDDNASNGILIEDSVAARVVNQDSSPAASGFTLSMGNGNVIRRSVAVGITGSAQTNGAGFSWPRAGSGEWTTEDNVSHHNDIGSFVWVKSPQIVRRFRAFSNSFRDAFAGAYRASSRYESCDLASAGGVIASGTSANQGVHLFERCRIAGPFVIPDVAVDGTTGVPPVSVIESQLQSGVIVDQPGLQGDQPTAHTFRDCTRDGRDLETTDFEVQAIRPGSVIQVIRRDGSSFEIRG